MREILFRGKGLYKDVWYFGNFVECKRNQTYQIVDLDENEMNLSHYIRGATLGQYTGLNDKNGKKIFDGDFVKSNHNAYYYKVYWQDCRFYIEDKWGNLIKPKQTAINHFECEVIGNVYDNPELLEVKDE